MDKKDDATYGDLAERVARMNAKYNPELEKEVRAWIESKTGESLGSKFALGTMLALTVHSLGHRAGTHNLT